MSIGEANITIVRVHNLQRMAGTTGGTPRYRALNVSARLTFPSNRSRLNPRDSRIISPSVDAHAWDGNDYVTFPPLATASSHLYYCNGGDLNTNTFYVRDCYLPGPCEIRCCRRSSVSPSSLSESMYPNHDESLGVCTDHANWSQRGLRHRDDLSDVRDDHDSLRLALWCCGRLSTRVQVRRRAFRRSGRT